MNWQKAQQLRLKVMSRLHRASGLVDASLDMRLGRKLTVASLVTVHGLSAHDARKLYDLQKNRRSRRRH